MNEFIEKLIERLEEVAIESLGINRSQFAMDKGEYSSYCSLSLYDVKENVKDLAAKYNDGWIPCSERLPDDATVYEVTEEILINSKKQYVVEHRLFGTEGEWLIPSNRKVIAWKPLPNPYREKGEKE